MNIKSLLLGSAATLVAVSGARAADAVVIAEPEPMEYVRICDTYGVGFYYIPGTETCLKVSGYIRYDVNAGFRGLNNVIDKKDFAEDYDNEEYDFDTNDTWDKKARFALRVDARSETELGTLRAYAAINFDYDTGVYRPLASASAPYFNYVNGSTQSDGTSVAIEHAYIELGGFRVGKTDSLFSTFTGYSSGITNDGLVPYGPFDVHQMAYTFTGGNGFSAAVALELGSGNDIAPYYGKYYVANPVTNLGDLYSADSYMPNVVGGLGWTQGWGGITGVVAYDAVWEEWAAKGRVDFNASDTFSLFVMAAYGSSNDDWDDGFGDGPNFYAPWGGDWAVWVGGAFKASEKATFNFEVGYDEFEDFSAAVNVAYEVVPNFTITPEVFYVDNWDNDRYDDDEIDTNWGARLRFQANFGG